PAILRDPARDPEQARRRDRTRGVDRYLGLPAVARHLARALGPLPSALSAVLLGVRPGLHRSGLSRVATSGRHLCHRGPHPDSLLFPPFPDHPAAAWRA